MLKVMTISSPAFIAGTKIPPQYTCEGSGINPALEFHDLPTAAVSLALIVEDPDSPGQVWQHWLIWNISPDTAEIAADAVPAGAAQGTNDFGQTGYGGPCPQSGLHHYRFRLLALDTQLMLSPGAGRRELDTAMAGHIIDQAEIVGTFEHSAA